jgi:hypothetical protein
MSTRPNASANGARTAQKAAAPLRKAPPKRPTAAPEKNSTLLKNAGDKPARYKPVNAGKGRVKGVPNAITKSAREIFQAFIEGNATKVQELWDRVARKSPAKALSIYAKLAEFIIPKLQRTELSGQLNHGLVRPAYEDVSPEEAARMYMEMIGMPAGTIIERLPSVKPYVAPPKEPALPPPPALDTAPRPKPAQPEPAPQPRRPENVLVLEPVHPGDHEPIADAKCAFCRQLWVRCQEDELLRGQRAPQVIT